jgi:hypothetical protein
MGMARDVHETLCSDMAGDTNVKHWNTIFPSLKQRKRTIFFARGARVSEGTSEGNFWVRR